MNIKHGPKIPGQVTMSDESPSRLRLATSVTTLGSDAPPPEILRGRYPTDALEAVISGRADMALVAREPYESELAAAKQRGRGDLRFIPIATGSRSTRGGTHAIAFFVHASNPLSSLSVSQLREILAVDGRVRTWGDLGVRGSLATACETQGASVSRVRSIRPYSRMSIPSRYW